MLSTILKKYRADSIIESVVHIPSETGYLVGENMSILFAFFLIGLVVWGYPILIVAMAILTQPQFWLFVGIMLSIIVLPAMFSKNK